MVYVIQVCCVYNEKLLIMDRGTVRNIQSFVPKNKFEKLVHLVGFIIRIYHNARSPERQTSLLSFCNIHIFSNDIYTQPVVTVWKRCLCWGPTKIGIHFRIQLFQKALWHLHLRYISSHEPVWLCRKDLVKSTGKTHYQSSYSTQVEGTLFHLTPRAHVYW